jgi:AcrR family transcriptional regulator
MVRALRKTAFKPPAKTVDAADDGAPVKNAEATRARILSAAREEFAKHGFSGARIDRIAEQAKANAHLLYRYFGNKEEIYLAVLNDAYLTVRGREQALQLAQLPPALALAKLVGFTFDFLASDPYFVRIIMNENLMEGRFAARSDLIPQTTRPLFDMLAELLRRGREAGVFGAFDPVEIYVMILSLCFVHVSNRHTLKAMFQRDLSGKQAVRKRRKLVVDAVAAIVAGGGRA